MQGASQSFQTPETLPRSLTLEKASETTPRLSPKDLFKRSLRQLDVSEEYPEVICATKLLFSPPSLLERIAGLAWQVKPLHLNFRSTLIFEFLFFADQNQEPKRRRTESN